MKSLLSPRSLGIDALCLASAASLIATSSPAAHDYPFKPVPFTAVHLNDAFWAPRLETNRLTTIPYAFAKCEASGRMYNFERAAAVLRGEKISDRKAPGFPFDDTDPYKVLEAAAFSLAVQSDPKMDAYLDKLIALIASAQEPDGYLYTTRTIDPQHPHDWSGTQRWVNDEEQSHELYNAGHLFEAAAAHYQATGKTNLLSVALKEADLLCGAFGPAANQLHLWPGHEIVEMGLAKLYRVTGNARYLNLAKYFIDVRGGHPGGDDYHQSHMPPVDQTEAIGHAVRAGYLYSGMADVAALTGDPNYLRAIDAIWENCVSKKLYLTGGIGARHDGEAFGNNYELPNLSAYNETCAAIANDYWNERLYLLRGDAKYIDVLERALYNGLLAGVSLDGARFFYPNPLESDGAYERSPWFGCACCPGNITRFLSSLPGYFYVRKNDAIFVNLYASGRAEITLDDGRAIALTQETRYPWDGAVRITVAPNKESKFTVAVRIPGWARNEATPGGLYRFLEGAPHEPVALAVNGKQVAIMLDKGYVRLDRNWKNGDLIELNLPMPVQPVVAAENVEADRGRIALQRGPIVYCAEWPDNPKGSVRKLVLPRAQSFAAAFEPSLLNGVETITGSSVAFAKNADGGVSKTEQPFKAIPYYAWANRGKGEMAVWFADADADAQLPAPGRARITIDASKPGHRISPTLWGIFFEDINNSADGGIYPEMVRNRSFEDANQPENWTFANLAGGSGAAAIDESRPLNPFNRRCLRVQVEGSFSLENTGYWGMNIVAGRTYIFSAAARSTDGFAGPIAVSLAGAKGRELAQGAFSNLSAQWQYHTLELTAQVSDPQARLRLSAGGHGRLFLDMVSLLPKQTWKNHGLRVDLAESIDALHPSFMRFPGGCWVEGDDFAHMNHWKNTIGNIDTRAPLWNIWGYFATHGLGFFEYLQLAEDLGAAPLFDINVGMSHREVVPMDKMDQWVQDALDAIEFANGPTNSLWGARRAASGHPAPFNLKYMEIGNENGGAPYRQRWPLFVKAIKEKYPAMRLIANHWEGSYPKSPMPDLVDEHYYETPEAFMRRATQYDAYERRGPKVFVGEYAVTQRCGRGNLRAAIGEAAFMTGIERNSDVVAMACYAPLFVNLNHRAWNPDLINFDGSKWYGLPGYYVQRMFSEHRGDATLSIRVAAPKAEPAPDRGMIGVGAWNTQAEFKDIKVTAPDGQVLFAPNLAQGAEGWEFLGDGQWKVEAGALRQTAQKEFVRAIAGSPNWTNYTLTLQARKLAGEEGFLILFHIQDKEDRIWWNIGGWKNTRHAVECGETLDPKEAHIETGRWYDIRVEVVGMKIKCYLDGQLIHDLDRERNSDFPSLFASASKDDYSGDLIVKVVNVNPSPLETRLDLVGTSALTGKGAAIVLTGASGLDENSLAEPAKVSPGTEPLSFTGAGLTRSFPGNSLTILRLKTGR